MKRLLTYFFAVFFIISYMNAQIASIKIKIPEKKIFLFGDLIDFDVDISSIIKFNNVKISLKGKNTPDFFKYSFKPPVKKERYRTRGKIKFIFFKTGEILTPSFTIELIDKTKNEDFVVYKEKFKGIKIKQITTLKGETRILGPLSPVEEEPGFYKIVSLSLIFLLFIFFLLLFHRVYERKKIKVKKDKGKNICKTLKKELLRAEKLLSLSKIRESSFLTYDIFIRIIKQKLKENIESLTVKEIEERMEKESPFDSDVSRKIIKGLKALNSIKYGVSQEKEELKKSINLVKFLIEEIENDKL